MRATLLVELRGRGGMARIERAGRAQGRGLAVLLALSRRRRRRTKGGGGKEAALQASAPFAPPSQQQKTHP